MSDPKKFTYKGHEYKTEAEMKAAMMKDGLKVETPHDAKEHH